MHTTIVLDRSFLTKLLPGLYWIVRSRGDVLRFIRLFVFEFLTPAMLMGVANSSAVGILMALAKVQGVDPAGCLRDQSEGKCWNQWIESTFQKERPSARREDLLFELKAW